MPRHAAAAGYYRLRINSTAMAANYATVLFFVDGSVPYSLTLLPLNPELGLGPADSIQVRSSRPSSPSWQPLTTLACPRLASPLQPREGWPPADLLLLQVTLAGPNARTRPTLLQLSGAWLSSEAATVQLLAPDVGSVTRMELSVVTGGSLHAVAIAVLAPGGLYQVRHLPIKATLPSPVVSAPFNLRTPQSRPRPLVPLSCPSSSPIDFLP